MKTLFKTFVLAAILPLILSGIAHANGVSQNIENGDVQSSSVTGASPDNYYYDSTAGRVLLSDASDTSATFYPWIQLKRPNGALHAQSFGNYGAWTTALGSATSANSGTWNAREDNYYGSGSGGYSATAVESITPGSLAGPRNGGGMIPSKTESGSVSLGNVDVFHFDGVAGATVNVSLTGGGGSNIPYVTIYNPSGAIPTGGILYTASSTSSSFTAAAGTYTVAVQKYYDDSANVSYTVGISGAGAAPPVDTKAKGKPCPKTCTPDVNSGPLASAAPTANYSEAPDAQSGGLAKGGSLGVGEPVNIANGNVFDVITDYTTVGQNPLDFRRYYSSQSYMSNAYESNLGPNWHHNYDRYIRAISTTQTTVERPDGQVIYFTKPSSTWVADADIDYTLSKSGTTWTLTDPDGVVESYTESAGKGTLNTITWPSGYTQTLAYSSGKLSTITDSYSRVLTLTYTSNKLTGVSTPDAATLTYGYTTTAGKDLLTSITYNTSPSSSQTYVYGVSKLPFHLTSITDENGNTNAQWTYDGAGRALTSQFAGGAGLTTITYDDANNQRTVTGPLGNAETYSFTLDHNLYKLSSISRAANSPVASATRNFTYDANGYLATATDWNGNSTHWTNNSHGQPTSITEAYGVGLARTMTIGYDTNCPHRPETFTRTNLVVTNDWDNSNCNLLSTTLTDDTGSATDGQTHVWTYTYTSYGLLNTVTEPRTDTTITTTYGYTSGALTSITDDLSHVWTMNTVNGTGQATQITDPNGVVTDFVYNNRNWLTSKTVNASTDEVTTYTYLKSGQPDVITLPDSSTIDYDYDNAQRLTKVTNTGGETINYTLNALGKPTAVAVKDSGGTTKKSYTATYDVLGDMLTLVGAGGANETTSFAYDGMQNRTSTTDARSKTTVQAWDALLRPSTVTDHLTKTAAPTYNNLDYVTAQTDFLGYSTSYTRDGFGNAVARSSPDSGSWSFTFDENNNVTGITDARSVASSLTYDSLNRLTARSITGYSGEAEAFTYDATAGGNKGVGRLTSWSDESGSGSRVYDNFGNITSETRIIGGKTYTTTYGYDLNNRITEIIYPSGRYVDYTYNSSGYLTTVTTKPSAGGGVTNLATSIVHKPFGPIASFTYGNSEAQTRTYSNNYWLTDLDTVYSGTYVQQLDFGYDYAGNLTSITDNIDNTRNETFTVDDLNRLATASGKYGSRTYTYDDNSGRATRVAGATTYTTTRVSSKNRVDHISDGTTTENFTWTANGNMATDDRAIVGGGSAAFTYGGRNKLESMTVNGNGITYKLNAFGQRVSEAFSGSTTHYIHSITDQLLAEANGSTGATTMEYVYMEGEPLAQIDGSGNIVYVHNNQVGAPQKITNPSRTVVFDQIREPFGEVYSTPTNTTPTNIRFPNQYANANNSLYHNGARDYFPWGGFYAESDPIGLAGGPNPLSYAGQNPTQWIDPTGLQLMPPLLSPPPEEILPPEALLPKTPETGRPAPFMPRDPYSPEQVTKRMGDRRQDMGRSRDVDKEIPDDPRPYNDEPFLFSPYRNCPPPKPKTPHEQGQRNQGAGGEEHSMKPKGGPSGGKVGNGVVPPSDTASPAPCPAGMSCA